jgi:hypothetical protein
MKLRCNACFYEAEPEMFYLAIVKEHHFQCLCGSYDIDTSAMLAKNKNYQYGRNNTLREIGRVK